MDNPKRQLETIDFRVKLLLLIVSLATIGILAAAAVQENVTADWRVVRRQYADILDAKATDARGQATARQFDVHIAQSFVPTLGTVDRCQTCHAGVEDPRMVDEPLPFTTHPGRYLELHDPEKFGCTVCHQGQGRATEVADAHGRVPHWDYPLLPNDLVVTTCTKCHVEMDLVGREGLIAQAGGDAAVQGAALFEEGRRLVTAEGCLSCHTIDGKGGTLSRDLTFVGDKTYHEFDFSHLGRDAPRDVAYWLREHFIDPEHVAPGTSMPAVGGEDAAEALTAYMLSRRRKEAGQYFHQREAAGAGDGDGGEALYARYCSACHGADGRAGRVPSIPVPALNNADTLAAASDDYYRRIIATGRSQTEMPAWANSRGSLSREEIDRIIGHMRSWEASGAALRDVSARSGDARQGRAYYRGMCAGCHGRKGEGGIGNSLNSPTFLAVADDRFLAASIIHGRPGTAMPSWKQLPAQTVSDLLAYIRSWQPEAATFEAVRASLDATPPAENARIGRLLYEGNCAGCHGRQGEGGAGPSLSSPDFLGVVDDRYLVRAITEGRPGTAMPAWLQLTADDVGALIAYLRRFQRGAPLAIDAADVPPGDYAVGEIYYRESCAGCHGEQAIGGVGPQLANPVFLDSVSDGALFHWIAQGRNGTAMQGFLPEAQGPTELTPGQIADVIAYLRHLEGRELPVLRTGVGDPKVGAGLFGGNCASCHGPDGGGASGPQLANPAFLRTASDGFLLATITLGRAGTPMPPMVDAFEGMGQLTPKDVQDIIAFMRLWEVSADWAPPRRLADVSANAIAAGEGLYASHCSSCHGPTGLGGDETMAADAATADAEVNAPALNNPEFLAAASDGFLLATIARGRAATPMRPFGQGAGGVVELTSQEISDIVAFIRSWGTEAASSATDGNDEAG